MCIMFPDTNHSRYICLTSDRRAWRPLSRPQRLKRHHRADQELRGRIDQLEKRQIQDDAVLNIINRYWNQLNEDVRVLLQRFDAETSDEFESKSQYYDQFWCTTYVHCLIVIE